MNTRMLWPPEDGVPLHQGVPSTWVSYSGQDMRASALVKVKGVRKILQLGNLFTVSYSTHRDITPVRGLGQAAPLGHVRGARTVAGSLVFTHFNKDALYELISVQPHDRAASGYYPVLADQIPPFNIIILCANELRRDVYGPEWKTISNNLGGSSSGTSRLIIYGATIGQQGSTMSVEDLTTEGIFSYHAMAVCPLTDQMDVWMTAPSRGRTSADTMAELRTPAPAATETGEARTAPGTAPATASLGPNDTTGIGGEDLLPSQWDDGSELYDASGVSSSQASIGYDYNSYQDLYTGERSSTAAIQKQAQDAVADQASWGRGLAEFTTGISKIGTAGAAALTGAAGAFLSRIPIAGSQIPYNPPAGVATGDRSSWGQTLDPAKTPVSANAPIPAGSPKSGTTYVFPDASGDGYTLVSVQDRQGNLATWSDIVETVNGLPARIEGTSRPKTGIDTLVQELETIELPDSRVAAIHHVTYRQPESPESYQVD